MLRVDIKHFSQNNSSLQTKMMFIYCTANSNYLIGQWDISSPGSHLAFHIYNVKYENTRAKGLVGTLGGDVLKIFFFSISYMYMYNAKSDHFSPKIKLDFMEIGNQMQNYEIKTKASLYMKMEAFDRH